MKRRTLLTTAPLPLLLAACSGEDGSATSATTSAADHHASEATSGDLASLGLAGADAATIVEKLDTLDHPRPLGFKASVTGTELVVTDSAGEKRMPLPDDRFYISIAPFVTTTHECFNHSLSGCQGEQVGKQVHVTATDTSGKVLVDKDARTGVNGFVGFWLPRNTSGTITATVDGRTGSTPFATGDADATCLTTLQLA